MTEQSDQEKTNSSIDSISTKIENLFKSFIGKIRIPNPLNWLLNRETTEEALNNAPDPSTNWARLGLSKTWWAFILIVVIIFAKFARVGIDALYRIAMFMVDSWVAIAFIFVAILLLRMIGMWNPILTWLLNFISKFKSNETK
tara:strand:+ start:3685 stop:4113 length:429 start_codon:yes stop_codon:yes gene_type:complete